VGKGPIRTRFDWELLGFPCLSVLFISLLYQFNISFPIDNPTLWERWKLGLGPAFVLFSLWIVDQLCQRVRGPQTSPWNDYRRWIRITVAMFLAAIPGILVTVGVFEHARKPSGPAWMVWPLGALYALFRSKFFFCPRCGEFFHGLPISRGFNDECPDCGLKKFEEPGARTYLP
jgi:hypothetical protein